MRRFLACAAAVLACGCSSPATATGGSDSGPPLPDSGSSTHDSGHDSGSKSKDGGKDATTHDGASGHDAAPDAAHSSDGPASSESGAVDAEPDDHAAPDAEPDSATAPLTDMILIAVGESSSNTIETVGTQYQSAHDTWAAMTPLGTGAQQGDGVSALVLGAGAGLGVVMNSSTLGAAPWALSWSAVANVSVTGAPSVQLLGPLVATPSGAAVACDQSTNGDEIVVDEYASTTGTWTSGEAPINGFTQNAPALASTLAGDLLAVSAPENVGNSSIDYQWSLRSNGFWSMAQTESISTTQHPGGNEGNGMVLASRVGVDQVLGVVNPAGNDPMGQGGGLESVTFSSGAWGTPVPVSTTLPTSNAPPPVLASLPDGRVALAYVIADSEVNVGFWSSSGWSTFSTATGVTVGGSQMPAGNIIGLAAGIGGDVLEMVYIDANARLEHARMTSDNPPTWTTPAIVDSAYTYREVALASGD